MIFWLCIYLLTIGAAGLAMTAAIFGAQPRRLIETVAFSVLFGCGGVPVVLLWLSMLGLRPTRGIILLILAAALLSLLVFRHRLPGIARPLLPQRTWRDVLALPAAALIVPCAIAYAISVTLPTDSTDAIAIWGLKAKVLFHEPLTPRPLYFTDLSLSYSHLDYPLLVPMLWAGAYASMGAFDDRISKIVFLLPVIALATLLYSALRTALARQACLLLTAVLIGLPGLLRWAGDGGADVPLAMFLLGAAVLLMRWIETRTFANAAALGGALAFAVMTKLEGMVPIASIGAVLLLVAIVRRDRHTRISAAGAVIGFAILCLPWLVWSLDLPRTHENYAARLTPSQILRGVERFDELGSAVSEHWQWWAWGAPLGLLLASAAIGYRGWTQPRILALWLLLAAQAAAYVLAYLITPWELDVLVPMTLDRLLVHLAPVAILIAGLHWGAPAKA